MLMSAFPPKADIRKGGIYIIIRPALLRYKVVTRQEFRSNLRYLFASLHTFKVIRHHKAHYLSLIHI